MTLIAIRETTARREKHRTNVARSDLSDQQQGYPAARRKVLWPVYLSGAGGFEWYVQSDGGGHDLDQLRWYDPRRGKWREETSLNGGGWVALRNAPDSDGEARDWAAVVRKR